MGLGVAICGGIILFSMTIVVSTMSLTISDQSHNYNEGRSEMWDNENKIQKTSFRIDQISAISGKNFMNFTLTNTGLEKFWDYENFNLIVTYDADISGDKIKTTESFTYDASSSFLLPTLSTDNFGSILFDSASSANKTAGPKLDFSHTVTTTGNSTFLIVSTGSTSQLPNKITYDGQKLTKIRQDQNDDLRTSFWYLVDPPTGSNVISISHPGTIIAGATSFTGVHQIDPVGSNNGTTGSGFTALTGIETNYSSWIADVVSFQNNDNIISSDPSQTEKYNIELASIISGHSTKDTIIPDNYDMSWTSDISGLWTHSVVTIEPGLLTTNIACTVNASFETNDWVIDSIVDDILDPHILNSNEAMRICAKLANPVYPNGEVQSTFVTDTGIVKSKTVTID